MSENLCQFIRKTMREEEAFIPLHAPVLSGNESKYIQETVDSTFVSSVGAYVGKVEEKMASIVGTSHAVATCNGTSALHLALHILDIGRDDLVITQALTFVATCNAISYCGADVAFVDVSRETLGMCPEKLRSFLNTDCEIRAGVCYHKSSGKKVKACVPMHTFGHPVKIDEIVKVAREFGLCVIEDSAESLGSYYQGQHTGSFGDIGIFSFNGNKIVTAGGGGMLVTNNEKLAKKAKHLSTQAKVPHKYEFIHDEMGFNYRMTNLNAALLYAQLEKLDIFVEKKRELASLYRKFSETQEFDFFNEPKDSKSNYWLNVLMLKSLEERNLYLDHLNSKGIMARPCWTLMNELEMYKSSPCGDLSNSRELKDKIINIPSSYLEDYGE